MLLLPSFKILEPAYPSSSTTPLWISHASIHIILDPSPFLGLRASTYLVFYPLSAAHFYDQTKDTVIHNNYLLSFYNLHFIHYTLRPPLWQLFPSFCSSTGTANPFDTHIVALCVTEGLPFFLPCLCFNRPVITVSFASPFSLQSCQLDKTSMLVTEFPTYLVPIIWLEKNKSPVWWTPFKFMTTTVSGSSGLFGNLFPKLIHPLSEMTVYVLALKTYNPPPFWADVLASHCTSERQIMRECLHRSSIKSIYLHLNP